jgi:hypothetical protein
MRMAGQLHAPAALPPGKRPSTHYIGGWVLSRNTINFKNILDAFAVIKLRHKFSIYVNSCVQKYNKTRIIQAFPVHISVLSPTRCVGDIYPSSSARILPYAYINKLYI